MSLEEKIAAEMARQDAPEPGQGPPPDRALAAFLRCRKRRRALDLAAKQKEGA